MPWPNESRSVGRTGSPPLLGAYGARCNLSINSRRRARLFLRANLLFFAVSSGLLFIGLLLFTYIALTNVFVIPTKVGLVMWSIRFALYWWDSGKLMCFYLCWITFYILLLCAHWKILPTIACDIFEKILLFAYMYYLFIEWRTYFGELIMWFWTMKRTGGLRIFRWC